MLVSGLIKINAELAEITGNKLLQDIKEGTTIPKMNHFTQAIKNLTILTADINSNPDQNAEAVTPNAVLKEVVADLTPEERARVIDLPQRLRDELRR